MSENNFPHSLLSLDNVLFSKIIIMILKNQQKYFSNYKPLSLRLLGSLTLMQ